MDIVQERIKIVMEISLPVPDIKNVTEMPVVEKLVLAAEKLSTKHVTVVILIPGI